MNPEQQKWWFQGLAEFNRGDYFQAHETWENLWIESQASLKMGIQGLIQVAVACVHLQRNNPKGTLGILQRACRNLQQGEIPTGNKQQLLGLLALWEQGLKNPEQLTAQPPWPRLED